MKILLLAGAALVFQMFLFLCLGSIILRVRGRSDYSLSRAALLGYFAYFGIFEVICLACEVTLLPLRTLALIMAVFSAAVIFFGLYLGYQSWMRAMNSLQYRIRLHGVTLFFMLAALAVSVAFVVLYFDASADSGWYVGTASTALTTDTIGRFDPSTGTRLKIFNSRYALSCFPFHNAVICSLLKGLPVIVQARSVMSAITVIMSFISVYQLGLVMFPDHDEKKEKVRSITNRPGSYSRRRADLLVVFVCVLNVLSSTIYMPGIFLYTRSYEGKAIVANVVLPAVLTICVSLWREIGEDEMRSLFWIMAAGVCFSASNIMALVLAVSAILPWIAIRGKWNRLVPFLCACIPVMAWAVVYYLMQHGTLVIRTWR